jgi:phage terminase large subunit-like protein
MNEWGRSSFLREAQHDTTEVEGGLWERERDIDPFRVPPPGPDGRAFHLGELVRIAVAIDPNAKGSDPKSRDPKRRKADDAGIMVGGIFARLENIVDRKGRQVRRRIMHGVLLEDATVPGGPKKWAQAAVAAFKRWKAHTLVAEDNNGGEMVEITIATVPGAPRVKRITASRGKQTRAEPVQKLCEDGLVHHLTPWSALEAELCTWQPGMASPNRLDAYVWLWTELLVPLQGMRFEAGFVGMKKREPDAVEEAA